MKKELLAVIIIIIFLVYMKTERFTVRVPGTSNHIRSDLVNDGFEKSEASFYSRYTT